MEFSTLFNTHQNTKRMIFNQVNASASTTAVATTIATRADESSIDFTTVV